MADTTGTLQRITIGFHGQALAAALLEQEVLERADIDRLLADLPRRDAGTSPAGALGIAAAKRPAADRP